MVCQTGLTRNAYIETESYYLDSPPPTLLCSGLILHMWPPVHRTLTGDSASPQHLTDFRISRAGWSLTSSEQDPSQHILVLCLQGRVSCLQGQSSVSVDSGQFVWLAPLPSYALKVTSSSEPEVLIWRFAASALPSAFVRLLPASGLAPAYGPAPLTPSMQSLVLGLRSCPVASSLRDLWGAGKLIEFLTLILPAPTDASPSQATARVLHPALRTVLEYLTAHLAEPIGLIEMAAAAHSSPSHLSRLFTAEFGHGPTAHLRRLRLEHAATLLRSGRANVTEAALAVGYQSLGQFSRVFAEHHGQSPSALIPRNNG